MENAATSKNEQLSVQSMKALNQDAITAVEDSHQGFYHFTTVDTAIKILGKESDNYIFVSPISAMNDLHERELHKEDGESVYAACFCNSDTDNIPMWYLYAGITGQGARIGLTPNKMHAFIESIQHIHAVDNFKIGRRLDRGVDFEMECGWVFYRQDENRIRYRNTYYSLEGPMDDFERGNYFVKDLEWKYEREFRIVFRVRGTPPERIAVPFDKKLLTKYGGLSVMLAPELRPANDKESDISEFAKRFQLPPDKVKFSSLKIKMDLVSRNRYSIIENFSEVLSNLKQENTTNICIQMNACGFCVQAKEENENPQEKIEMERLVHV